MRIEMIRTALVPPHSWDTKMSTYHIRTICPSTAISSKEEKQHSALPKQAGSVALLILPNSNCSFVGHCVILGKKLPDLFVPLRRTCRIDRKAGVLPPYPSTAPAEIRVCSSWSSTAVTLCWKSLKEKRKKKRKEKSHSFIFFQGWQDLAAKSKAKWIPRKPPPSQAGEPGNTRCHLEHNNPSNTPTSEITTEQ